MSITSADLVKVTFAVGLDMFVLMALEVIEYAEMRSRSILGCSSSWELDRQHWEVRPALPRHLRQGGDSGQLVVLEFVV